MSEEWIALGYAARSLGVQKKTVLRMVDRNSPLVKKNEKGETLLQSQLVIDIARSLGLDDDDIGEFAEVNVTETKVVPDAERTKWKYKIYTHCPRCKVRIFHNWCLHDGDYEDNIRWIGVPYKPFF